MVKKLSEPAANNKNDKPLNIFVLSTGRCGSVTFSKACMHITNFTVDHESRCSKLGDERLAYPSNHIEVDNRLSWFLPRLEKAYGDDAVYIHLTKDPGLVAESYNRRWTYHGSIAMAYARGILKSNRLGLEPCIDYVRTVTENIEAYLATKSRVFTIDILQPEEQFRLFWKQINAEGDLNSALKEFSHRYNVSANETVEPFKLEFDTESDKNLYEMQRVLRMFESERIELLSKLSKNSDSVEKLKRRLDRKTIQFDEVKGVIQTTRNELKKEKALLKSSLANQLGLAIARNIRSPIGWLKMPFAVLKAGWNFRKSKTAGVFPNSAKRVVGNKATPYAVWHGAQLIKFFGINAAVKFINDNGDQSSRMCTNLMLANGSIRSDTKWLKHVNRYLEQFDITPLELKHGDLPRFFRIAAPTLNSVSDGPLVSIIMPAFNAEKFLEHSAGSILKQTWKNIELIIVDDASTDDTWSVMQSLSKNDSRVKILRNSLNVGPYVSKNRAVQIAQGQYFTGHDADDWATPQRIEKHVQMMLSNPDIKASTSHMLRINKLGEFTQFMKVGKVSPDGALRLASISCMFETEIFRKKLGNWDSVRFGADSELIERARSVLGSQFASYNLVGMLCLDEEGSLTNHPEHGVDKKTGISPIRREYRTEWANWHENLNADNAYLNFPQTERKFASPADMLVDTETIIEVVSK